MADKVCEKPQEQVKEKGTAEDKKEEEVTETPEKKIEAEENGDVEEEEEEAPKNGKDDSKDTEEKKEEEPVSCPVKRKSVSAGGDAPDGTAAEDAATPEKKAKLSASDANDKSEVAA